MVVSDIHLNIVWQGKRNFKSKKPTWEAIVDRQVTREASFAKGSPKSSPVLLFRSSSIQYEAYYFQLQFTDPVNELAFLSSVSFNIIYENFTWTKYQIVFKTVFFVISLAFAIYYSLQLRKVKRRLRSYEQTWVRWLSIVLVFYNNPLYFLNFVSPRKYCAWIDILFQTTFVAVLLLFWLITFDAITKVYDSNWDYIYIYICMYVYIYTYLFIYMHIIMTFNYSSIT